jgi:myo-inositol-1-phosphate synthase
MLSNGLAERKIRIDIVGVGNCASSFIQGLSSYRDLSRKAPAPGLMSPSVDGYSVAVIETACDVGASKVGRDICEAIHVSPKNTCIAVKPLGRRVVRRYGLGHYLRQDVQLIDAIEPHPALAEQIGEETMHDADPTRFLMALPVSGSPRS